jgi:hypothetical protein
MIQQLLKLRCCLGTLACGQKSLAPNISRIETGRALCGQWNTQLDVFGRLQRVNCFLRSILGERNLRPYGTGEVFFQVGSGRAQDNAPRLHEDLGETEIENFRLPSVRDEDVRWLDIPMDDSLPMCCVKSVGNLDTQIERRFDLQGFAVGQLPECLSLPQFHHDEGSPIGLIDFVDRVNVRVV